MHDRSDGRAVVIGRPQRVVRRFRGPVGRALRRELHGPRIRPHAPGPAAHLPLDRIYWDRHLVSDGFRVHRSRLARVASDHLPVVRGCG